MYQVLRNNQPAFEGLPFTTFESARQAVRRFIRTRMSRDFYERQDPTKGMWDSTSRNPTNYTILGYRITKV